MPTGKQIRAARMLLEWDAVDLAEKSKLTKVTILNMETGKIRGRPETMEKIVKAFKDSGVEFNGDRGVSLIDDNYRVLKGEDCYLRLLDEVYHTIRSKKDADRNASDAEVLSICTDDSASPPEVVESIQRWHKAGIKCRFLSHEQAMRFDFPLDEYRLISSKYFKNSVMVVYADKVATLRSTNDAVLIVNDKEQADMLRGLFELIWSQSVAPNIKEGKK